MSVPPEKFSWLPEALEPVALRLARADALAFQIGDIGSKWSLDGPVAFEQRRQGGYSQMVVKSVRPVPPEASLLFSEAVNHLRAAVDNVVWHLVEEEGPLSGPLGSRVSMPITETQDALDQWVAKVRRIPALGADTKLGPRIRALQPFVDVESGIPSLGSVLAGLMRVDVESAHPLRLLQAYSNRTSTARSASPRAEPPAQQTPPLCHVEPKL